MEVENSPDFHLSCKRAKAALCAALAVLFALDDCGSHERSLPRLDALMSHEAPFTGWQLEGPTHQGLSFEACSSKL